MNITLWILQGLLAIHTIIGAIWKFSNSEQTVQSLKAIPHYVWHGLSVIEIFCAIALVLPALSKKFALTAPVVALVIAAEMILYCVLHLFSKEGFNSQMIYWIVVTLVCGFIAYGRFVLKPH